MKRSMTNGYRRRLVVLGATVMGLGGSAWGMLGGETIPTTIEDFFMAGTQPETLIDDLLHSNDCIICHGVFFAGVVEVAPNWQGSMMAQASRDPLFYACLTVANQDANAAGETCIRCHTPMAWLAGRSDPPDGSGFVVDDRDGVNCHTCHRMVDPVFKPGVSPPEDEAILADIIPFPVRPGNGNFIIDPLDRRRGPFFLDPPPPHSVETPFLQSPFHKTSEVCATCHDVSNQMYVRQGDGTYALGELDEPHPTGDGYDMFPIERTYSEWLNSDYPDGVDAEGRFGGNLPTTLVSTCQDCHMPDRFGNGCIQGLSAPDDYPPREDMPRHDFAGGNTWIRDTIVELWPDDGVPDQATWQQRLDEGQQKSIEMLQLAASLEATQDAARLDVRVINESGHKLPTGYPEGRRMWLNVQFFDVDEQLIAERGVYELLTADLSTQDTKVYEIILGLDAAVAALTGLAEGPSFHIAINNSVYKDNRLPPRGFTNADFEVFGGLPVGASYEDGQYWDDTAFALPADAVEVTVNLYYQTSSKEYIEFLRDENHTNDWGDTLYDLWESYGKSEPVLMVSVTTELGVFSPGDFDGDDDTDLDDFVAFDACVTGPGGGPMAPGCEVFDFDVDQDVDFTDLAAFQLVYTGG